MKVKAEVYIETDEFPDHPEHAREKAEKLLQRKLVDQLSDNDIEDFELLSPPGFSIEEVDYE